MLLPTNTHICRSTRLALVSFTDIQRTALILGKYVTEGTNKLIVLNSPHTGMKDKITE